MDVSERIERGDPEDEGLEYKSKEATNQDLALELAAIANHSGGALVLGVRDNEDGAPGEIQHIEKPHERIEAVTNVIYDRVEPNLAFDTDRVKISDKTIIGFIVDRAETLHSFKHSSIEEPVFPVRRNTRVGYLQGHEVGDHYKDQIEKRDENDDLLRLPDGESSNYFIKAPDGHISDICLFSNIYYPGNPVRIHTRAGQLHNIEVEHIFAVLEDLFRLSSGRSSFTVNQSNAAWIGKGYENFIYNLRDQDTRYKEAKKNFDYELELYGNEQAVFISNFDMVYPESIILIYAAPFTDIDGYRHISINFLIDGFPTDIRPLIEFVERTDLHLSQAHEVSIPSDGIKDPSKIPVKVVERSIREDVPLGNGYRSVDGALIANPFYDNLDYLNYSLDLEGLSPLTKYQFMFGNLIDWDDPDEPHDYEAKRIFVRDWNEFARGVYGNVKEIRFDINW